MLCPIDEGVDDLIAAWLREQEVLGVEGDPATAFAESCLQQATITRVVGESVAAGLEDQHGYVEIGDSVPQLAQHAVDLQQAARGEAARAERCGADPGKHGRVATEERVLLRHPKAGPG